MSRHRAEPDDEAAPPPTSDTGPLMFGNDDWPLPRPPEPPTRNGRSTSPERGQPPPADDDFGDSHFSVNHFSDNRVSDDPVEPKPPSDPRPTYNPDVHNHMTSEIAYPVQRQPVVPVRDRPPPAKPPVAAPPVAKAPVGKAPIAASPVARSPLADPPVTAPPVVKRPVAQPPVAQPPVAQPPVAQSPVSQLPVSQPPVVQPVPVHDSAVHDSALHEDGLVEDVHDEDPADELGLLTPTPLVEKGHRRRRGGPREGRRRPLAVLLTLGLIAALVTGIFYGGRAALDLISSDPPPDYTGQGTDDVEIEIPEGASTSAIADILVESDVVASAQPFLDAAAANPDILTIQPGVYSMRLQMSGQAALDHILDPAARLFDRVTIPEGFTVAHTLETLADSTDIPLADYQAAAAAPEQLGLPAWANGQLEGFLYPETYDVGPDSTAVEVLSDMVAQFNQVATETGLEANAAAVGKSPYEVLIIASLIQSEVTVERERPLVARVIYNRLGQSMPLGIDSALAYELQINGNQLTTEMLTTDSPYNTRIRVGLPPTPISNPGQPSMLGALQPAAGDWLYYVLQNTAGEHLFTASYEEFLAAKAQCEAQGLGCG